MHCCPGGNILFASPTPGKRKSIFQEKQYLWKYIGICYTFCPLEDNKIFWEVSEDPYFLTYFIQLGENKVA